MHEAVLQVLLCTVPLQYIDLKKCQLLTNNYDKKCLNFLKNDMIWYSKKKKKKKKKRQIYEAVLQVQLYLALPQIY